MLYNSRRKSRHSYRKRSISKKNKQRSKRKYLKFKSLKGGAIKDYNSFYDEYKFYETNYNLGRAVNVNEKIMNELKSAYPKYWETYESDKSSNTKSSNFMTSEDQGKDKEEKERIQKIQEKAKNDWKENEEKKKEEEKKSYELNRTINAEEAKQIINDYKQNKINKDAVDYDFLVGWCIRFSKFSEGTVYLTKGDLIAKGSKEKFMKLLKNFNYLDETLFELYKKFAILSNSTDISSDDYNNFLVRLDELHITPGLYAEYINSNDNKSSNQKISYKEFLKSKNLI